MTGLETYQAFLAELKKENTTTIFPDEFNYHIWRSELNWVTNRYWAFDQHQKSIDDLDVITIETNGVAGMPAPLLNAGAAIAGQEYFALPDDLLILLNVAIEPLIQGDVCIKDNTLGKITAATFLSADREKVVDESHYSKPSFKHPTLYYKIRQGNILVKMGSSIAQKCIITYLQYPQRIGVDPVTGANVTDSPFGDSQTLEIVRDGVLSYLETIESSRVQSMAAIESRKFTQNPLPNQFNPF